MRRAILQRFANLLVARMLADEHPDSSLRHVGWDQGRETVVAGEGGGTQGDAGDFKEMSKKATYLQLVVGGKVTSSQDLATDLDVDVTSRSKYIEEPDYATSYLEAWQARTVRESKTEQRTASFEKETVLAS